MTVGVRKHRAGTHDGEIVARSATFECASYVACRHFGTKPADRQGSWIGTAADPRRAVDAQSG